LPNAFDEDIGQGLPIHEGVYWECIEKIGVNLNQRNSFALIVQKGLNFCEYQLPHFREANMFEIK